MANDQSNNQSNDLKNILSKEVIVVEEKQEQIPVKRRSMRKNSDYTPVVIDKDAFERTMGRFENYKDEEEERARKREEAKQRKLEEERMRFEQERLKEEQRKKEEEKSRLQFN